MSKRIGRGPYFQCTASSDPYVFGFNFNIFLVLDDDVSADIPKPNFGRIHVNQNGPFTWNSDILAIFWHGLIGPLSSITPKPDLSLLFTASWWSWADISTVNGTDLHVLEQSFVSTTCTQGHDSLVFGVVVIEITITAFLRI
jgi:hypothetical protein